MNQNNNNVLIALAFLVIGAVAGFVFSTTRPNANDQQGASASSKTAQNSATLGKTATSGNTVTSPNGTYKVTLCGSGNSGIKIGKNCITPYDFQAVADATTAKIQALQAISLPGNIDPAEVIDWCFESWGSSGVTGCWCHHSWWILGWWTYNHAINGSCDSLWTPGWE